MSDIILNFGTLRGNVSWIGYKEKKEKESVILSQLGKRDYEMTVYHEKCSLYSPVEKKKRERFEIKSWERKKETFTRDNGMES